MKSILEREFVAVDINGNELRITDIDQLIRDFGFKRFLREFCFDFNDVWYEDRYVACHWEPSGFYVKSESRSTCSYALQDVNGRQYSPEYIVSLFVAAYPQESKRMLNRAARQFTSVFRNRGCTSAMRRPKRIAKIKRMPFNRQSWQTNFSLQEEGLKPIRKIKQFYHSRYDDDWYRTPQRCWKSFREVQYK